MACIAATLLGVAATQVRSDDGVGDSRTTETAPLAVAGPDAASSLLGDASAQLATRLESELTEAQAELLAVREELEQARQLFDQERAELRQLVHERQQAAFSCLRRESDVEAAAQAACDARIESVPPARIDDEQIIIDDDETNDLLAQLQQEVVGLRGAVAERERVIASLDQDEAARQGEIDALGADLNRALALLTQRETATSVALRTELIAAQDQNAELLRRIGELENAVAQQDAETIEAHFEEAGGLQSCDPVPPGFIFRDTLTADGFRRLVADGRTHAAVGPVLVAPLPGEGFDCVILAEGFAIPARAAEQPIVTTSNVALASLSTLPREDACEALLRSDTISALLNPVDNSQNEAMRYFWVRNDSGGVRRCGLGIGLERRGARGRSAILMVTVTERNDP